MKTISLEQLEQHVAETLRVQCQHEPILVTRGDDALGLLLKLPDGTKGAEIEGACWMVSTGAVAQVCCGNDAAPSVPPGQPEFGRCQGMLTAVAEDEEHLRDFADYMP